MAAVVDSHGCPDRSPLKNKRKNNYAHDVSLTRLERISFGKGYASESFGNYPSPPLPLSLSVSLPSSTGANACEAKGKPLL